MAPCATTKPAETVDIACAPPYTQIVTPVRPTQQSVHNSYRSICDICLFVQNPYRMRDMQSSKKPQNLCGMFTWFGIVWNIHGKGGVPYVYEILNRMTQSIAQQGTVSSATQRRRRKQHRVESRRTISNSCHTGRRTPIVGGRCVCPRHKQHG